MASIQTNTHTHQSNTNAHSIIQKSMLIATDFLSVGFSSPKTFTLTSMPPTQSFCAKPKTMSQNPSSKNNPRLSGEGGLSQTMGEGRGRDLSPTPHLHFRAPSPQGVGFPSLFEMWILQLRASPSCRMT